MIAGLRFPMPTFYIQVAYCIARIAYNIGYMFSPNKRVVGAIVMDVAVLSLIVMAYMTLTKLM